MCGSSTPLSPIDQSFQQKLKREILDLNDLNDTINQMGLTVITKHSTQAIKKYIFFSIEHEIFSKAEHIMEHKASLKNTGRLQ